jgi:hypothetical protein
MAKRKRGPGRPFDDKRWGNRPDAVQSMGGKEDEKPPGLYASEVDLATIQTPESFTVRSGAIHSKSEGWVPMVTLTLDLVGTNRDVTALGTVNIALEQDTCMALIHQLEECLDRSREDARVAFDDIQFIPKRDA